MRDSNHRKGGRGVFVTIVLYVTCLTLLVVALCAGVYYTGMNKYLKKQIEESDDAYLSQLSSSYELFLKNTIDSSMVFIENDAKNVMSLYDKNEDDYKKQMYRHLESIARMTGFIDSVYFYDRDTGMVYLSSGISYERNDFYDGAWLETLKDSKNAWEILTARQLEAPLESEKNVVPIIIRYPFVTPESPYLYVIHMRADQLFQYLLKSMSNRQNKSFKVMNNSRNIFISSDSGERFKNVEDFPYLAENWEAMQAQSSGSFLAGAGKEKKIVHFTSSSQYQWLYISEMDYEIVGAQLREPLILLLLLTAGILACSFLLCFAFSKRLYRPVETLQNMVLQNESLMERQFFYNLLAKNYYTKEEIDSRMEEIGMQPQAVYVVTLFSVDEWKLYLEKFDREEKALWEYAFENIACEVAAEYGKAVFVGIDANRFALLFAFEEECEAAEAEAAVQKAAARTIEALENFIHFSFSAGIGMASTQIYTIHKSYEQAREVFAVLEGCSREAAAYRDIQGEGRKLQYSHEGEQHLMELIKNGDSHQAESVLFSIYKEFKQENGGRKEDLSYFTFLIITAVMKQGNELGFTQEEIFDGKDMTRLWEISAARKEEKETLEELKEVLTGICRKVTALREGVSNSQVRQITQFIQENYHKPITLGDIAEHIGVSQSTVSRLMTQNLKMSTVDYMNQVRIEKAIQLIHGGAKKVADISEETGFNNTHYFIRVFKKITGTTPGSMIEELKRE